ncbi:ATP-binding protein [Pyrobaculum aerophilum]|uniref:AAA family ATPase n=1 Tax=Pyrobaculum aerophilum TaxID=13773 RepID=A0A371QVW0_9CREN|nr:ATP-binding protein [Pyrobaculum aerophilum]RFA94293.1 AAA family ATPase [Pyrobaculum aerophilum]RFA94998.1 AAA family ATPase [Pyrobaculum aerophilum]
MRRIKLAFANTQVEFVDRDLALRRVEQWAERGTFPVQVVYGPEGCGKTAWLRQSAELLREMGFDVIYLNPIEKEFSAEIGVQKLKDKLINLAREAAMQLAWGNVVWSAIDIAREAIALGRRKIAIIIDDAFQAVGVDKAAIYVKGMLGILEHPPEMYEKIVAVAATSEGVSLREIGRHLWSTNTPIWNMGEEGFRQLYEKLPGDKPPLEEAWKTTGGNPRALETLYEARWNVDKIVERLTLDKKLTGGFTKRWKRELEITLEDPDYLWREGPEELASELVNRNLIVFGIPSRDPELWIDEPPPERDPELGIGRYVAWQTPLHREAVRKALQTP